MSQEQPLTPAERIALVESDKARRYGQIIIAFILIGFSLGYLTYYSIYKADDAFLSYLGTGMLALVFAGIGAAYAIMGLGRTVGSNNNPNPATIAAMMSIMGEFQKNGTSTEDGTDEFYTENFGDFDDDDVPVEVPPGKATDSPMAASVAASKLQYLADRNTWHKQIKKINGSTVKLVATQESRRTKRKRTIYVYHIVGTNVIIYNRSRHGVYFMRIAFRPENVKKFFQIFVEEPLTEAENNWLERYDYILV